MRTPISAILAEKGDAVYQVRHDATVRKAVQDMNERHIGSLVVTRNDKTAGIFTERDVLVRIVAAGRDPDTTRVEEVMSGNLVVIHSDTSVEEAMFVVTKRRHRHLPVVDADEKVVGMVSIGDLTRWLVRDRESYIENLSEYIWGTYSV